MRRAFFSVSLLGSLAYAIYAYADNQSPAIELIRLQAASDGHYYVKFTILTTWLVVFGALMAAGALVWMALRACLAFASIVIGKGWPRNAPLPSDPSWKQLLQRSRVSRGVGGLAAYMAGLVVAFLFLFDLDDLLQLGWGSAFLMMFLGACSLIAGSVFLLDGVFLPELHIGQIEDLRVTAQQRKQGADENTQVFSGGQKWSVPVHVYKQLIKGAPIALLATRASSTILDLRIQPAPAGPADPFAFSPR